MQFYNPIAEKKAVNLSVNSNLLAKAREMNINLSSTFEIALSEKLKQRQREHWLQDNKESIEAYNKFIEEGVFGDDLRSF